MPAVVIPPEPRAPFISQGSIVPPPPDYLFELPKSAAFVPKFPASIPPFVVFTSPAPSDEDEGPPTVPSHPAELIEKSKA